MLCERSDLSALIEEAARLNIFVLLDEAFIDYVPNHSLVDKVSHCENLIVFRSVTKFHGIPGLRVAYSVAGGAIADKVRRNIPPWSITTLAATAVRAALSDIPYAERTLRLNLERRDRFMQEIEALGLRTYPAAANFLLLRFSSEVAAENCWEHLILRHGIVLRHCGNFEALSRDHLRCAVRNHEQNSRLIKAMSESGAR
jgi:threonine-phosphate decarboxylase